MNTLIFVNIVNLMNDLLSPKDDNLLAKKRQREGQFTESGLYVKEDDQDWGSAGMDDVQKDY